MNIKNLSLISILLLSGCTKTNTSSIISSSSISSSSSSSSSIIESTNKYNDVYYEGYYKTSEQSIDYNLVRRSSIYKDIPSIGEAKVLVVPVSFTDSSLADSTYGGKDKVKEDIEKVFFGKNSDTGWESIQSYYQKSSYGKLNITGKVTDWFNLDLSFEETANLPYEEYQDPTIYVVREIGKWYQENYDDASEYDLDKDGHIDAIWMVYDYEANSKHEIDWAYTFWDYLNPQKPDTENPIPYTYAWASIDFMYAGKYVDEDDNSLVDAHTFIHETGHLLGLEDYYDYDNKNSYAGKLDMMDYNIGDHTALSKYMLKWTNPYVVTDSCEITINSFEETGDFILVKDDWNHSSLDEYLLIEFYTPTGLNELDSLENYKGTYPLMYTIPGIKIYHVDARIGFYQNYRFQYYVDEIVGLDAPMNYSTQLAHSNTLSRSSDNKTPLYHLLERNAKSNLHSVKKYATNDTLFIEGDRFDSYDFYNCFVDEEEFNDGEYINYFIDITEITDSSATITFTKLS